VEIVRRTSPMWIGRFQASRRVELVNEGPITLILDSRSRDGRRD
jgi:D-Tyr-tRNAtyr deacylase